MLNRLLRYAVNTRLTNLSHTAAASNSHAALEPTVLPSLRAAPAPAVRPPYQASPGARVTIPEDTRTALRARIAFYTHTFQERTYVALIIATLLLAFTGSLDRLLKAVVAALGAIWIVFSVLLYRMQMSRITQWFYQPADQLDEAPILRAVDQDPPRLSQQE